MLDIIILTTVRRDINKGAQMKNENSNTKQKIQQTALDLFSKRGYSAVSIRDIGKIVGVKESTIYYHFKNKQDIFQTLLFEVQEITSQMTLLFNNQFEKTISVEETAFIKVGLGVLEGFLLDKHIIKFIRMLMIEQHVNEEAALLYQNILFDTPLKQNEKVFQLMMDKGYFKQDDAMRLAVEYYGFIYFIFQRYFSSKEVTAQAKEIAKNELSVLIKRFYKMYSK